MDIFLLSFASFRITRLLVMDKITEFLRAPFLEEVVVKNEDGEEEIYVTTKGGKIRTFFGEMLSCYWCTGIWVTIFLCLFYFFAPLYAYPFVIIFAIAGIAAGIETFIQYFIPDN